MEMRWLPRTRRLLGGSGATFTRFTAPQPLCCPARAQILTGQYAQNNGVRDNSGPHGGIRAFEKAAPTALPVWLQQAGYRTGFVGKYLNAYTEQHGPQPGWEWFNPTVRGLFDYRGFGQYDDGELTEPAGYHTDYLADESADFIAGAASDDRPFFLWASYSAPHGTCRGDATGTCSAPPIPAARHQERYDGVRAPFLDDPAFNEADVSDKPRQVTSRGKVSTRAVQRLFAQRIRALAAVDDAVAATVRALREAGELDRTLIAFTSDNGFLFGQHRYVGKILGYEEAVRVPLLLRGPGIPEGVQRRQTTAMIDLAPTFADLAGAGPLVPVDGRSLLPYARGNARQRDRTLLVQAGARGPHRERKRAWMFRGVRTDRYTYLRWSDSGFVELYDRQRDPHQLRNLARDPRYSAIERILASRTKRLVRCEGEACRHHFRRFPQPLPYRGRP
jgi:arylsulfatase A-like enzyme